MATIHDFYHNTGRITKAYNAKRDDIITPALKNNMGTAWANFTAWVNAGYVLYDVIAKGGLTYLSADANAYVLCVFQSCKPKFLDTPVTGTAQAGAATSITLAAGDTQADDYYKGMVIQLTGGTGSGQYNTITAYNSTTKVATVGGTWGTNPNNTSVYNIGGYDSMDAADLSPHTKVVLSGLYLHGQAIIGHTLEYRSALVNNAILEFAFLLLHETGDANELAGMTANYCIIYMDTLSHDYKVPPGNNNTIIANGTTIAHVYLNTGNYKNLIIDCSKLQNHNIIFSALATTNFHQNIYIKANLTENIYIYNITNNPILENIYINKCMAIYGLADSTNNPVIYVGEIGNTFVSNCNVAIRHATKTLDQIIDSEDWDLNMTAIVGYTYAQLDALVSSVIDDIRVVGNAYGRRYYQLSFKDKSKALKQFKTMFSRNEAVLVINREDLENNWVDGVNSATTGAWIIKNSVVYEHDGTTPVDYRNNEHFFIICTDSTGAYACLSWYDGHISKSVFSVNDPTETYTAVKCIQILEPPQKVTWRNKDAGTEILDYEDAPIEMSSDSWFSLTSWYNDQR